MLGNPYRKILIISSHPLFGKGIGRLLESRREEGVKVVGIASSVDEAMAAAKILQPDLIVVDYDDGAVNREEFLARFVESEQQLRVVLLSLKEGGSNAIVYDRRAMAASDVDDWLKEWVDQGNKKGNMSHRTVDLSSYRKRRKLPLMKNNLMHAFGALLFVVIFTVLGLLLLRTNTLLPVQASLQAVPIDNLFNLHFKVIAFLFALIVGIMLYSILFFRRKKGDLEDAVHITGNTNLEFIWTVIPLLTVIGFSLIGSQTLAKTLQRDPKPLEVKVTGQQWSWRFDYPDSGVTATDLVLPVNKQVLLRLNAVDVIHSFWVPEFRIKQDLVPGQEKQLRITPDRIGNYELMCAEICGRRHAYMIAKVSVVSAADYKKWVDTQLSTVSADPVVRGQSDYLKFGCKTCHTIDGTRLVGPSFKGIYGNQVTFDNGTSTVVDDAYIIESIREPGKQIVQSYPNAMPANIGKDLTDAQIQDLIAFIKSLK